jgi:hypothetical protein
MAGALTRRRNMPGTTELTRWVDDAVATTGVCDLHTHLYPPSFGPLMLWGIDEVLTYHYLVAELFRSSDMAYDKFWALSKSKQADLVWRTLFVERAPLSESCRGALTVLSKLGLDPKATTLKKFRAHFAAQKPQAYLDRVLELARVRTVVMTNDPLDPIERAYWLSGVELDPRFGTVLRIDPLLLGWPMVAEALAGMGYPVTGDASGSSIEEIRRFLSDWIDRLKPLYIACSLPPAWHYPQDNLLTGVLEEAVLPVARQRGLPFAMMIGAVRGANPQLRLAGDAVGKGDVQSVHRLCAGHPHNKFMCTMLARENAHELAVAARKHRNLLVFGCWWFLNNPSLIEEITRMRVELLGTSFVPQHSDARVLDQLLYKWEHSRQVIGTVLKDKFADLAATGWRVTKDEVDQTVQGFLAGNFETFLKARLP